MDRKDKESRSDDDDGGEKRRRIYFNLWSRAMKARPPWYR